jgi:predicted ATPase
MIRRFFLAHRIQGLPPNVREVIVMASCFGCIFDPKLLQLLVNADVQVSLNACQGKGFVEPLSDTTWRFVHDQFQQSAYSLVQSEERNRTHLLIGRKLWTTLSEDELSIHTFSVVDQLRRGAHLIESEDERVNLSALLLRAGEKASSCSSFQLASTYLNLGLSILGARHWRDYYHLSLNLTNAAAEVSYCNANFKHMDSLIKEVLEHGRNRHDKSRAMILSIYSLGSQNRLQESISLALSTLKELGFKLPQSNLIFHIIRDMVKTKNMLKNYTNKDILNLPRMTNPEAIDTMQIYSLIFLYTLLGQPFLVPIITLRMVQTTLKYGLSNTATVGFAYYSMMIMLSPSCNDVEYGTRMALLSLDLLKMFVRLPMGFSRLHASAWVFLVLDSTASCASQASIASSSSWP